MSSAGSSTILARAKVLLEGDSKKFEEMMSASSKELKEMGEGLSELGEKLTEFASIELAAMAGEAIHAFGEAEDAMARVNAVLRATGGSAGVTADYIAELGASFQETTTFAHDTVESASATLMTFKGIRDEVGKDNDVFTQTMKTAGDLAALTGGDLRQSMLMIGRAMEDPTTGLLMMRRAGIVFSATEKQMIIDMAEHNNVMGAQKEILRALQQRIGGLAQAMAQTPTGKLKQLWNEVHDAFEAFGKVIFYYADPIIKDLKEFEIYLRELGETSKTVLLGLLTFVAILGPLALAVGTVMKAWAIWGTVMGSSAVAALGWVAAASAVITTVLLLIANWKTLTDETHKVGYIFKDAISMVVDLGSAFLTLKFAIIPLLDSIPSLTILIGDLSVALTALYTGSALGGIADLLATLNPELLLAAVAVGAITMRFYLNAEAAKEAQAAIDAYKETLKNMNMPALEQHKKDLLADLTIAKEWVKQEQILLDSLGSVNSKKYDSENGAAIQKDIDERTKKIMILQGELDATMDAIDKLNDHEKKGGSGPREPTWLSPMLDAMSKFRDAQQEVIIQEAVLGDAFDEVSATAENYKTTVDALLKAHVPLNARLNAAGETLGTMILTYRQLNAQAMSNQLQLSLKQSAVMTKYLGDSFDSAGAEVSAYQAIVDSLIKGHYHLNAVVDESGHTVEYFIGKLHDAQINQVLDTMNRALAQSAVQSDILGDSFKKSEADASAYQAALTSLSGIVGKHGVFDITQYAQMIVLGEKLRRANIASLVDDYSTAINKAEKESAALGGNFDLTGAKIDNMKTLIDGMLASGKDLDYFIPKLGVTLGQLIIEFSKLSDVQKIAQQVEGSFNDMLGGVVDALNGVKVSFRDLVRSALIDLQKLILQMLVVKGLKTLFGADVFDSFAKVLGFSKHADGGLIKPGTIGLVGERGPEFIYGGRTGVAVTPMPAQASAGTSEMSYMNVNLNVNAMDSRDVQRFFDENEEVVAATMMSAFNKSSAMRRTLRGR